MANVTEKLIAEVDEVGFDLCYGSEITDYIFVEKAAIVICRSVVWPKEIAGGSGHYSQAGVGDLPFRWFVEPFQVVCEGLVGTIG